MLAFACAQQHQFDVREQKGGEIVRVEVREVLDRPGLKATWSEQEALAVFLALDADPAPIPGGDEEAVIKGFFGKFDHVWAWVVWGLLTVSLLLG